MMRETAKYDAKADAARWPEWRIGPSPIIAGRAHEAVIPAIKTIGIAPDLWEADPDWWTAHAIAHLDYHWDELAALTAEHEEVASLVADIRLDREGSR